MQMKQRLVYLVIHNNIIHNSKIIMVIYNNGCIVWLGVWDAKKKKEANA